MKMALKGDQLLIREADNIEFTVIKSWGKMKWTKATQTLAGTADIELLDKLEALLRGEGLALAPSVEARRQEMHRIMEAVDRERVNPEPVPFVAFPVKLPLYKHQVRGANMALLAFGFVDAEGRPTA